MEKIYERLRVFKEFKIDSEGKSVSQEQALDMYYLYLIKEFSPFIYKKLGLLGSKNGSNDIIQEVHMFIWELINKDTENSRKLLEDRNKILGAIWNVIKMYLNNFEAKTDIVGTRANIARYFKLKKNCNYLSQEEELEFRNLEQYKIFHIKRYERDDRGIEENPLDDIEYSPKEETYILELLMKYMTEEEFELLYYSYVENYTNSELAFKYKTKVTTIKKRKQRLITKVREALLDDGYDLDDLLS